MGIIKVFDLAFEQPKNNKIGAQLKEIIDFLIFYQEKPGPEDMFRFNLVKIRFLHPMLVLAISTLIDFLESKGHSIEIEMPSSEVCSSYLERINFPKGIRPDELANWEKALDHFKGKNYLPIVNFSASREPQKAEVTNRVLSKINKLIRDNLELEIPYVSAVSYLISEITDNIVEHSGVERGWLTAQYYPTTEYLDICIIDTGKTLYGSYRDAGQEVYSDDHAIDLALKGISTKSPDRGTGIPTSRSISKSGLDGDFALFSGKALYYNDNIINLPVSWPGTFVAIRIKKNVDGFDFYSHM